MALRTPETLTAVQRMKQLEKQGQTFMTPKPSKAQQETLAAARAALAPIDPERANATAGIDPKLDLDGSFLILPIDEIEPYRYNPRTGPNPNYEQIKESIRADGITNMLSVTRRDPGSSYTIYGGGNTRLKIAKELYAEGDERFATLRVVYKTWPGDAQVITAHLVENENRGDISFWEKAQGVEAFKREFEQENEHVLTAGALNRELKKRGLNYGVRTLQNFAYAAEHFAAIGPWLQARFTNETLRPAYAALEALGVRLTGDLTSTLAAMREAMAQIGARLSQLDEQNRDLDVQDQQLVLLDEVGLIDALRSAAARHLEVSDVHLADMLQVLQDNPKIDADGLRQLAVAPQQAGNSAGAPAPADAQGAASPAASPASPTPTTQPPLGAMLADVSSGRDGATSEASGTNAADAQPESTGAADSATAAQQVGAAPEEEADDVAAQLQSVIREQLEELAAQAPIQDVILIAEGTPFFYVVDLPPAGDFTHCQGNVLDESASLLRAALWRTLAAFSLQFDERVATLMAAMDGTRWAEAWGHGAQAFRAQCEQETGLQIDAEGQPLSAMADMTLILQRPEISYPLMRVVGYSMEVRLRLPERAPQPFQSVFAIPSGAFS